MNTFEPRPRAVAMALTADSGISWVWKLTSVPSMSKKMAFTIIVRLFVGEDGRKPHKGVASCGHGARFFRTRGLPVPDTGPTASGGGVAAACGGVRSAFRPVYILGTKVRNLPLIPYFCGQY